jgi:predicted adenylyl cyclase CyaB
MKNIELKIQVDDFKDVLAKLKKNRAAEKGVLKQIDIYYNCEGKRLKLREENGKLFQLVLYIRPDKKEAKVSDFDTIDFGKQQAQALKAVLKKAYGEKVVVKKERKLWMYKNTRIHLDKVEKLGTFLELETFVKKNLAPARKEYDEVVKLLDLDRYEKLKKSYSDMLIEKYIK